jgi:hypothetical protein
MLGLFTAGVLGILLELLLMEHFENGWQLIPVVLLAGSVVALPILVKTRARSLLLLFRFIMLLFVASGILGVWLHYDGQAEFKQELKPDLTPGQLAWEVIFHGGLTPPLLAPGAMAYLGLHGLICTHRFPSRGSPSSTSPNPDSKR